MLLASTRSPTKYVKDCTITQYTELAATNARAIIPPTEIVVAARTTFRLEQWNRFANPESNAQSFGKLVTQADGTIYNYDGVASEVVNAQLRIERLVHA